MDVGGWLRNQGLGQYEAKFRESEIDAQVLLELTELDLEKLGVPLGHRKRLLKAIASLSAAEALATNSGPAPTKASPATDAAERRQVTVMFCDLVGSTAMSGALDPEVLGGLIRRYQDAAAGAIGRFGGFVAKFMGDGVLAYFGFPRAYEDAAERAVRAALAIVAEVSNVARPDGKPLQTRIGIATGLVVVGEIIGAGTAQEHSIIGETPNLAARLQALAAPDTILIGETTRHLLGALFDLEPTGEHELKGFAHPMPVWCVRGEASVESRFAAIRPGGKLSLIGRAHEMGLLLDRWRLARSGEGQIVAVIGEAGIGKSRIVEALQEALAGEPHARIHLQCSPYHSDSALYPLIQHLARAARFVAADSPSAKIEKLGALFASGAADTTKIPLLAELMSIPVAASTPPLSLTPAQRKAAITALLVGEIVRLGQTDPVLLVLEDAHWIDATTLELMMRLTDSIGPARLLALVTARSDFAPPWLARPHAMLLTLGRLGRAECARLIAEIAPAQGLSADTVAAIVARTDGVPLFVEELTKSVMESAGRGDTAVPATLQDSLMARLDRLGEGRDVAQIASVIGRQFTVSLLDAVAVRGGAGLEAALAKLVAAGIVFPEGRGLEGSYSFKHALVRDAAYDSLLMSRRRHWHERIARVLEERFPELAANEPELLAHHFGEAGFVAQACNYRGRAGARALSRSAYKEAIAHFSAGLKLAETLPDAEGMRRQLDFLLKLGPSFMVVRGFQSSDVEDAYRRAADIGERLGDGPGSFKAKWGLWLHGSMSRKTKLARDRARELVTLAERSGDGDLLLEAYHCRWSTSFFCGDVAAGLTDSRIGMNSYDMARHRHLGQAFGGHDPGVCAFVVNALSVQMAGDREQADKSIARALDLAGALDHPASLGHALNNSGMCHQLVADRETTLAFARQIAALAEKFGLLPLRASSSLLTGWATAVGSGVADAARLIDAEIANATAAGPLPQYYLGMAGEVLLAAGRPADGLAHLDRAIAAIDEPGVGFYLPEIYRWRGECLLALGRDRKDEARQAFATARSVARQQGAVIFERRADAALAKFGNTPPAG
jgi:class 3 adenylate cyclase/tetratricopeptide (TPR) repeat protein